MSTSSLCSSSIIFKGKPSTTEIFQAIKPRICLITTSKGHASGCFISKDGIIATAMHIFQKTGNTYKQSDIEIQYDGKIYSVDFSPTLNGNLAEKLDVCLLKIKEKIETPYFDILDKNFEILEGQKLYFAGVPLTQTIPTFHKGYISSKSGGKNQPNIFTIDGTVVRGNSGGPVTILIKDKLYLAGTVTHLVANVDPEFFEANNILSIIKNQEKNSGMVYTLTLPNGEKRSYSESKLVIKMLNILNQNMSTGIGRALDARHIHDLTNKTSLILTNNSEGVEVGKPPLKGTYELGGRSFKYWEHFPTNAKGPGPRGITIEVEGSSAIYKFDKNPHQFKRYNKKQEVLYKNAVKALAQNYNQNQAFPDEYTFTAYKQPFVGTLEE